MELEADQIKSNIKFISKSLGFSDCRIAKVKPASHGDRFREWIADGTAGDMKWLEKNVERRINPEEVLEGAKSMVCLALNYYPGEHDSEQNIDYKIARYAWNEDYHDIIDDKLRDLNFAMEELGGKQRFYVDTGPVLERDFASDAGLGWNGSHRFSDPRCGFFPIRKIDCKKIDYELLKTQPVFVALASVFPYIQD